MIVKGVLLRVTIARETQKRGDPADRPNNIIVESDLLWDFDRLQLLQGPFHHIETALPESFLAHVDPRFREDLFGGG